MVEKLHPYVVFLPTEKKDKILSAIFGSKAGVDVLRFSLKQGISKDIYQKDLVKSLNYSNKTIIENLKTLTKLGIIINYKGMELIPWVNRKVLPPAGATAKPA